MSPACPCPNNPTSATARAGFKAPLPGAATRPKFPRCRASTWDVDGAGPEPPADRPFPDGSTNHHRRITRSKVRRTPTTRSRPHRTLHLRLSRHVRRTLDRLVLRPVRPVRSTPVPHHVHLTVHRRVRRRARRLAIRLLRRLIAVDTAVDTAVEPTGRPCPHLIAHYVHRIHRVHRRLRRLVERLLHRAFGAFGHRPAEEGRSHRTAVHRAVHRVAHHLRWAGS